MADLESLIKYRRHDVDEKRKVLAKLYEQADSLMKAKREIEEQLEKETALALELGTAEALSDLGAYSIVIKKRITSFEDSIKEMDQKIALAQEEMRESYSEMKKVEITQRNRKNRELSELEKRESRDLDEIGLDNYRRLLDQE